MSDLLGEHRPPGGPQLGLLGLLPGGNTQIRPNTELPLHVVEMTRNPNN